MRRLPRRQRAPFCGHPWQRCLADAQPDEKIPEHLILFVDALSDPRSPEPSDGWPWLALSRREALPMEYCCGLLAFFMLMLA